MYTFLFHRPSQQAKEPPQWFSRLVNDTFPIATLHTQSVIRCGLGKHFRYNAKVKRKIITNKVFAEIQRKPLTKALINRQRNSTF